MVNRKQALEDLEAKVEAGNFPADTSARDLGLADVVERTGVPITKQMYAAFSGSLDAAKALHEAVLPGWEYKICIGWADISHASGSPRVVVNDENENARAWLLAILSALIAEEDGK